MVILFYVRYLKDKFVQVHNILTETCVSDIGDDFVLQVVRVVLLSTTCRV